PAVDASHLVQKDRQTAIVLGRRRAFTVEVVTQRGYQIAWLLQPGQLNVDVQDAPCWPALAEQRLDLALQDRRLANLARTAQGIDRIAVEAKQEWGIPADRRLAHPAGVAIPPKLVGVQPPAILPRQLIEHTLIIRPYTR